MYLSISTSPAYGTGLTTPENEFILPDARRNAKLYYAKKILSTMSIIPVSRSVCALHQNVDISKPVNNSVYAGYAIKSLQSSNSSKTETSERISGFKFSQHQDHHEGNCCSV